MVFALKQFLVNAAYYFVTVGLFPWALLTVENSLGLRHYTDFWLRITGLLVGMVGVGIQCWCIYLFHNEGKGTPSPLLPTSHLIMRGPYAFCRNPMNVGELAVFIALALWFGSIALLVYTIMSLVIFNFFIVFWEEPVTASRFGEMYGRYCASVPRWIPRLGKRR
jgi:protein-S-isoprenylcysteine O-methyltransferase Ste14